MILDFECGKPEFKENCFGAFFRCGDNDELLAYVHRSWNEGDDVLELEEMPSQEKFIELMNTTSFILNEELSKRFQMAMDTIIAKKEAEENGSIDSAE